MVPSWKKCNECSKGYCSITTPKVVEDYFIRKQSILEEAKIPLRDDQYYCSETISFEDKGFDKKCYACGMELLNEQKRYCDDVCESMYRLYPGMLGMFRR